MGLANLGRGYKNQSLAFGKRADALLRPPAARSLTDRGGGVCVCGAGVGGLFVWTPALCAQAVCAANTQSGRDSHAGPSWEMQTSLRADWAQRSLDCPAEPLPVSLSRFHPSLLPFLLLSRQICIPV